jgi:S1-C subfamily serine protease
VSVTRRSDRGSSLATLFVLGVMLLLAGSISLLGWVDQRGALAAAAGPRTEVGGLAIDRAAADGAPDGTATAAVSVVRITADTCEGRDLGTGFVVGPGGAILTARHVIEGAASVRVQIGARSTTAAVIAVDERRDVALLSAPRFSDLEPVRVGVVPTTGAVVRVFGHPWGGALVVTRGAVVGFVERGTLALDGHRVMTVSAPVEPGQSGGPVLDDDGHLVGVAIGVETNTQTGLVVPVDELTNLIAGHGLTPPSCPAR